MEDKQQHHGGGSGFLFGIVVGAAVTLLFTTKKGREVFKTITEEGVSKVRRKIEETKEQLGDFEDMDEAEDYIEPEEREPEKEVRHLAEGARSEPHNKEESKKEETKSPRKFFRRS